MLPRRGAETLLRRVPTHRDAC